MVSGSRAPNVLVGQVLFKPALGNTLPDTNIAPKSWWLEDEISFGTAYFQFLGRVCVHTIYVFRGRNPKSDNFHWERDDRYKAQQTKMNVKVETRKMFEKNPMF